MQINGNERGHEDGEEIRDLSTNILRPQGELFTTAICLPCVWTIRISEVLSDLSSSMGDCNTGVELNGNYGIAVARTQRLYCLKSIDMIDKLREFVA